MGPVRADKIPLAVVGCDFRTASASWRERLILSEQERRELRAMLERQDRMAGLLFLNTCNRTEWIASASEPQWIATLLASQVSYLWELAGVGGGIPTPKVYIGREAARHVFRVVAGLESFVMGEQQIARQFHVAAQAARSEGSSTSILNGLEKIAGGMIKKLAQQGLARKQSVGIHSVVARYVEKNFFQAGSTGKGEVAVVGMGQIGRKVAGLLEGSGKWKVVRVNRTLRSAGWVSLERLWELAERVDGIVFCSASEKPLCTLSELSARRRRGRELWIVDIGVPAQVAADRKGKRGVILVPLDRLVEEPVDRMHADWIRQVELEVEAAVKAFEVFCRERPMVTFLESSQGLHRDYMRNVIPQLVEKRFGHLPIAERKEMISGIRKLLMDYTSSLIECFHKSSETSVR